MAFGNLLAQALTVIPPVPVSYHAFKGNTVSQSGIRIREYNPPTQIGVAIVQAVKTDVYHKIGLDFRKNYRSVYIKGDASALQNAQSPDKLSFYGKNWIIISLSQWYNYDGWTHIIVVEEKDYV